MSEANGDLSFSSHAFIGLPDEPQARPSTLRPRSRSRPSILRPSGRRPGAIR